MGASVPTDERAVRRLRCILSRVPVALVAAYGCADPPGTLVGPFGIDEIRTAWFTERVTTSESALTVLLSNGDLPCTVDAAAATNGEYASLLVAACREGAQHLAIGLHDPHGDWQGRFVGDTSATRARRSDGAWYGIDEAFLVQISGLDRAYLTASDRAFTLGDGGEVDVSLRQDDTLEGVAWFPEGVSAEFRATRCDGPALLLELVRADPGFYCASPPFGYVAR